MTGPEAVIRALAEHYGSNADHYERRWANVLHPVSLGLVGRLPLRGAGFEDIEVGPVAWSYRPTMEDFVEQHRTLGSTSRRLAKMGPDARDEFLRAVRERLSGFGEDAFADRREILAGTATAR